MSLLDPTEVTILRLRRHPFVFLIEISLFIFLMIVPVVVIFLINATNIHLPDNGFIPELVILLLSVYYLYLSLFIFNDFFLFFLDRWIVTNKHIIDIEQKTMFHRMIAKQELDRVQDVTAETNGIIGTFLDYGDVHVQTAGTMERSIFHDVAHPHFVADTIIKALDQTKKTEG